MSWDVSLFLAINGLAERSASLDELMLALGAPSLLWWPGALLGIYWLWLNWREALIAGPALAGIIGVADFLGAFIKDLVARPRPCHALSQIHEFYACGKTFGFPSNHAVNTAAAAAFLHVLYPKSGWITWPIVALGGFSRVYVGAHYVTDVLGGWVIGGCCGAGVAWLLLQWPKFRQPSGPRLPLTPTESLLNRSS